MVFFGFSQGLGYLVLVWPGFVPVDGRDRYDPSEWSVWVIWTILGERFLVVFSLKRTYAWHRGKGILDVYRSEVIDKHGNYFARTVS